MHQRIKIVIPGRTEREPGIHNHDRGLWLPGLRPRGASPNDGAISMQQQDQRERAKMPEITVSMAAGRTDEQKAGMMRDITQALVKNLGVDADNVVIQINEAPLTHKMKGGKTFVERAAAAKK